ncbi:amidohydrolase [uncultured Zhongshania sp.]|uniref:amidohydrolase n=1 Tax=uncultured Zhongshania sp. TaxID=1642288 RepID=UPI0030DB07A4|tara:strand:+ start:25399 stop:26160 length:762 start_codon:yes stop_codon:yes gene_type:complete
MKIAALQSTLYWQDRDANLAYFGDLIENIGTADVVVLPEMFTTGFSMAPEHIAEPADGPTLHWLRDMAQQHQIAICGSVAVQENSSYYNRFYWVSPEGESHYDKHHLFRMAGEHKHYAAGMERKIVEYQGVRICLQVCYDLRFPVYCRNRNDYDLLIFVANWPEARRHAWSSLLTARAIENQSYVIGVNRVGEDGNGINYSGDSVILDYLGQPVANATANMPAILSAEISLPDLQAFREKFPAHLDADGFELK